MQIVYQDEDERSSNRETDSVDIAIYTRRISKYLKGECVGRSKSWKISKEGYWNMRQ